MSTTPSVPGTIADAVVAYVDANKSAVLAQLATQNVTIADFIERAALSLVAKNPVLNMLLGGALKGAGPQLVTYLGGDEAALYALVDTFLHAEAVKLGG